MEFPSPTAAKRPPRYKCAAPPRISSAYVSLLCRSSLAGQTLTCETIAGEVLHKNFVLVRLCFSNDLYENRSYAIAYIAPVASEKVHDCRTAIVHSSYKQDAIIACLRDAHRVYGMPTPLDCHCVQ